MKIYSIILFLVIFICISLSQAYGDYLKVSRLASIKAEPTRDSRELERVEAGTILPLLDGGEQSNGYYHVETISLGQPGWIYRTFARRYSGEIPEGISERKIIDPLTDPKIALLTPEQKRYAFRHLRLGKPQAVYERVREGYVLAQSGSLKIPLWVQYELGLDELHGTAERENKFRADASIPFGYRAELADYQGSGFDRGHMAPAADMKRNEEVMGESFLLSNITPQVGKGFNQDIWEELEASVRSWVEQRGNLTIITGPIFATEGNKVSYKVIGKDQVAVPTHFYKIIVDANNPHQIEALAFILPNQDLTGHHYSEYLTTIDEVEKATGLDFLSALPAAIQDTVEAYKAQRVW
jgi:endonuclease G